MTSGDLMAINARSLLILCLWLTSSVQAQVAWTSIYVDGTSQVDLWTQEAEGCQCPWDTASTSCACCVKSGGCHCGMSTPHRCMQCGLEEHCSNNCDWLYQDFSCRRAGSCVMASPGYPGVYPPNRQCKYHITTSSIHTRVRISFRALLLPYNHCVSDYVAIYQGSTTSSPHLITLCGNRRTELEYSGPNLLLEFSSGPQVPPFDYNGFLASLEFSERSSSTESSVTLAAKTIEGVATVERIFTSPTNNFSQLGLLADGTIAPQLLTPRLGCDVLISGTESRSGHFDTRGHEWYPNCRLVFKGRSTDVVHVSLFNYRLRSPACNTVIEIVDGPPSSRKKPLQKICSPQTKHARDHGGSFLEHQTFVSTGNVLTLLLRRPAASASKDVEFVDGAFLFHDEQMSGTLQPSTMCDVHFYGMSSPSVGMIDNPGSQHLYWNIEGPLRCSQQFIPGANQSIAITIRSLGRMSEEPKCQTHCGDGGCVCVPLYGSLSEVDHILLVSESGHTATCLCGDFQSQWMPVSVRSWGPLSVVYSVAHYTWNTKGFEFSASYIFNNDAMCGTNTLTLHTGELKSKNMSTVGELNYFYHQNCIWILDSNVERQLFIELSSSQNRPCSAWNISVHEYSSNVEDQNHLGELLYTFCPRDRHKTYSLPWKLNTVIVRLRALSRTPPQYKIKWRSQVVRANTRLGSPTPAPKAISGSEILCFKHDAKIVIIMFVAILLNIF
ncbi:uncharacterized protein CBL_13952 [Carabus blaptoides fortunei]